MRNRKSLVVADSSAKDDETARNTRRFPTGSTSQYRQKQVEQSPANYSE
jgi:hypothetical protein